MSWDHLDSLDLWEVPDLRAGRELQAPPGLLGLMDVQELLDHREHLVLPDLLVPPEPGDPLEQLGEMAPPDLRDQMVDRDSQAFLAFRVNLLYTGTFTYYVLILLGTIESRNNL